MNQHVKQNPNLKEEKRKENKNKQALAMGVEFRQGVELRQGRGLGWGRTREVGW